MQNKAQHKEGLTALGLTSDRNAGATAAKMMAATANMAPTMPMWMRPTCWRMRVNYIDEGEGMSWAQTAF